MLSIPYNKLPKNTHCQYIEEYGSVFTEREWKPLHWQTCMAFISNSIIVMLTTGITYIPTSEVPIELCNIHRYRSYAHSTYTRLCIMHHTLPNRDVYSIYQTDRDDQGTTCRGHICHSFGHKVHAFTHADITPSGAFLPGLSVSWDGLLPNREPTCLQGNAHGSWGHACDDSSHAHTALISA